jgi:hypothetical protein
LEAASLSLTPRDDLAFELGEGEKNVERQPSRARSRVERLSDRYERDLVCIEQLDELGEVGKRSGQAIDFLDHDDIDLFGSNQV